MRIFLSTNSQLHADVVDVRLSGTTAITVLAERRDGDMSTLFRAEELERAKLCAVKDSLSAVAMREVVCVVLTKEKFETAVGPLTNLADDTHKYEYYFIFIHDPWCLSMSAFEDIHKVKTCLLTSLLHF